MERNDKSALMTAEVEITAHDKRHVEFENRPIKSSRNDEDMIATNVKSAVKELVANELKTMVEKSLDDILRTSLPNWNWSNRSVVMTWKRRLCWTCSKKECLERSWMTMSTDVLTQMQPPIGCRRGCCPQARLLSLLQLL